MVAQQKTTVAKRGNVEQKWYVVDATDQTLGRLASEIAMVLMGKHRPMYTPHVDTGEYVIVINAEKVRLTGKKMTDREYVSHTGYPGGQRFKTPADLMRSNPARIIEMAVKGMLPKNRIGRRLFTHLFVYSGSEHPHAAQSPTTIEIKTK